MYLVLALLALIVMFLLIPGLAWFEDRMLGPQALPTPTPPPSTTRPAIEPAAASTASAAPAALALPAVPRPTGHTVRSGRARHARRPTTSLHAYRHHIGRRRPPRAPVFR
ncbi:hypothetical protein [Embleya sp. NPDC050493]|uniref:hypothetical protein n=1 Tax=Embleya sp. NPDC050493 TaxID=3363989 RepID=UPI0037B14E92